MEHDILNRLLDWLYSVSRFLLIGIYTSIIAVINPLRPTIVLIFLFALFDFVIGYGAARNQSEEFSASKAFNSFKKLIVYLLLIILINLSMTTYNEDDLALTLVKYTSWFACVIYLINILKNLVVLFPNSKGFKLAYKIVTVDFKNWVTDYIKSRLPKV